MASKLEKAEKTLGNQTVDELDKLGADELRTKIVQANEAMRQAHDELEANTAYQRAKADVSMLSQGKKDVNKRQNAIITYALHRLEEIGSPVLEAVEDSDSLGKAAEASIRNLKKLGVSSITGGKS